MGGGMSSPVPIGSHPGADFVRLQLGSYAALSVHLPECSWSAANPLCDCGLDRTLLVLEGAMWMLEKHLIWNQPKREPA